MEPQFPPCRRSQASEERWPALSNAPTVTSASRSAATAGRGARIHSPETARQVLLQRSTHPYQLQDSASLILLRLRGGWRGRPAENAIQHLIEWRSSAGRQA